MIDEYVPSSSNVKANSVYGKEGDVYPNNSFRWVLFVLKANTELSVSDLTLCYCQLNYVHRLWLIFFSHACRKERGGGHNILVHGLVLPLSNYVILCQNQFLSLRAIPPRRDLWLVCWLICISGKSICQKKITAADYVPDIVLGTGEKTEKKKWGF